MESGNISPSARITGQTEIRGEQSRNADILRSRIARPATKWDLQYTGGELVCCGKGYWNATDGALRWVAGLASLSASVRDASD